jgi:hopanoid biosynthesis associated protein HpnK
MLRRLVVNADDLGLTIGVNDGIFDAHDHGILTSASLLANAPATEDAARRSRSHPSLGIGVHLALVDAAPVLPPALVPSLVEDDGRFRRSWKPFIVACLRRQVSLLEVEHELTAQIERVLAAGIRPTHLDAHKHVHAFPPVFAVVAKLAVRFGISVVRIPHERVSFQSLAFGDSATRAIVRRHALLNAAMWPWAWRNRRAAAALGLRTPHVIGRIHTGVIDAPVIQRLLQTLAAGVTELMVHPGYADGELARTATRLRESRQRELALLCSMATRARVAGERIELVRHDLTHVIRRSIRHVS